VAGPGIGDDGQAGFVDILLVVDLRQGPVLDIRIHIHLRTLHEGVVEPAVKQVDCDGVEEYVGIAGKERIFQPGIGNEGDTLSGRPGSPVAEAVRRMDSEARRGKLERPRVCDGVTVDRDAGIPESQAARRCDSLDRVGGLRHRSARGRENTHSQADTKNQQGRDLAAQRSNRRIDSHVRYTPCVMNDEGRMLIEFQLPGKNLRSIPRRKD
jgi:hypothetical protein